MYLMTYRTTGSLMWPSGIIVDPIKYHAFLRMPWMVTIYEGFG